MLVKEGNGANPLLGFTENGKQLSTEETDQVERSEKKVKRKAAEYTGDLSFRYLKKLMIAKVKAVKVYAASAIVVIWW
jgi:hypothetical protein